MRTLVRASLLVVAALMVPIVPVVVLGLSFQDRIEAWFRETPLSPTVLFGLIALTLSTDVFLPVPSSMVSTYGGGVLGLWPATAASWLGMTIGACLGFGLSRVCGPAVVSWLARRDDMDRITRLTSKVGPLAIVLTRALPILAEACIVLAGATQLSWRRFLLPVAVSNFVVSLSYAACGQYFQEKNALPIAVVASGTVPLIVALFAKALVEI